MSGYVVSDIQARAKGDMYIMSRSHGRRHDKIRM